MLSKDKYCSVSQPIIFIFSCKVRFTIIRWFYDYSKTALIPLAVRHLNTGYLYKYVVFEISLLISACEMYVGA